MVVHTTALFLVALAAQSMALWTTYDKPFTYECGENQVLYHLESVHNNHYEDRKWQFECKPLPKGEVLADCELIGYVNDYDKPFNFMCGDDKMITGMHAVHHNHFEDRIFKFKCCKAPDYVLSGCTTDSKVNNWDGRLDYTVKEDKVLSGVFSTHNNYYEDRVFSFSTCKMSEES